MCSATTLSLSLFFAAAQREKERYLLYTRVQSGVEEEEGGGGGRRRGLAQRGIMMQRWRGRGTLELAGALAIGRGKPLLPRSPCWYYNDRARERERESAGRLHTLHTKGYVYIHTLAREHTAVARPQLSPLLLFLAAHSARLSIARDPPQCPIEAHVESFVCYISCVYYRGSFSFISASG